MLQGAEAVCGGEHNVITAERRVKDASPERRFPGPGLEALFFNARGLLCVNIETASWCLDYEVRFRCRI